MKQKTDKHTVELVNRLAPQPLIGYAVAVFALALLSVVWRSWVVGGGEAHLERSMLLALALMGAVVLAYHFPIAIRQGAKTYVASVPLYLMTVLLPTPLAATAAGLAVLAAEVVRRKQNGTMVGDILTQSGRIAVLVLVGSMVASWGPGQAFQPGPDIAAAVILWVGELVTSPLVLTPITRERPAQVIVKGFYGAGLVEAAQYLVGLLGAFAAKEEIWAVVLITLPSALLYFAFKSAKEMHDNTRQLLESMADTVDLRDPYTGGHSRRVAEYCGGILREMKVYGPEAEAIISAARLHDIGKIGIADGILNKQGPLTAEERAVMETHPERGADLLRRYPDFARGVEIVLHHHERWDGKGYPHRLRETQTPFGSRVIAVADSYDAMTSDRPYRKGMTADRAISILREGRGMQWDGAVVDAFLRSIGVPVEQAAIRHLRTVAADDGDVTSARGSA